METAKKKAIEAAGWKVGSVEEFLGPKVRVRSCETREYRIFVGLDGRGGQSFRMGEVWVFLVGYAAIHKLGFSVNETRFIYPGGEEEGFMVSVIQHPNHLRAHDDLEIEVGLLAYELLKAFEQERVFIIGPNRTEVVERVKEG